MGARLWDARMMLLLALAVPAGVSAQQRGWDGWQSQDRAPRAWVGLSFVAAQPTGAFERYVDEGWGAGLHARLPLDQEGWLSIRGDIGFAVYGRETIHLCSAVSCRVDLDLTTTNSILFGGVGPEIGIPGRRVRPYAYGTWGIGYFNTTSTLGGSHGHEPYASTVNFDDAVFQSRLGGGVQLRVAGRETPVFLDLGAEYHANGEAEYLREGDIVDHPDGSITLFPQRSEANLLTFRVGVSVGVGGAGSAPSQGMRREEIDHRLAGGDVPALGAEAHRVELHR